MAYASGDRVVNTSSIVDNAVTTAKVNDDAITLAKIAAGTDGELITWDASGDPAAVATGTSGQILTSNGAGAAPTFQTAATVDLTDIGTSVISDTNNTDDLGTAAKAWKDLYLAGGIYIGGTTSANFLDDYEEGTWTGAFLVGGSGGTDNTSSQSCTYTKVGRLVNVGISINLNSSVTGSGECYISGLPFTVGSGHGRHVVGCNDKMDMTGSICIAGTGTGFQFLSLPQSTGANLAGFAGTKLGSGSGKGIYMNYTYYE